MLDYASILDETSNKSSRNNRRTQRRLLRTDPEFYIQQLPHAITQQSEETLRRQSRRRQVAIKVLLLLLFCSSYALVRLYVSHMALLRTIANTTTASVHADVPKLAAMPSIDNDPKQESQRLIAIRNLLVSTNVSDSAVLTATTDDPSSLSPQYQALHWIANIDTMQRSISDPLLIQRYVLAVLYFATGGHTKHWAKQMEWLQPIHECDWKDEGGVRNCDSDKYVVDISLWNQLQGTIPSELGFLSKVQVLYLSRNKLTGTIPTTLGKLSQLTYLGVQHNLLTGTIPTEIGNLSKLKYLGLEKNDLRDDIHAKHPLCVNLRTGITPQLSIFSADCRGIWTGNNETSKLAEVECDCCTECFRY